MRAIVGTESMVELTASWIWSDADPRGYNQAVEFRRTLRLDAPPARARVTFSADTVARVFVNGEWIGDGPCRGWPHAYHYDVIDVARHLRAGDNKITAIVRYHGVGTFHGIPQRAGFLLQLDVSDDGATWRTLAQTDATWLAAEYAPWRRATPKVCIQMGPAEWIDARREVPAGKPAIVFAPAGGGPWGALRPRDVVAAGRYDVPLPPPGAVHVVRPTPACPWAVPVAQLCHPGIVATNIHTSRGLALAAIVHAERDVTVPWRSPGWIAYVNGRPCGDALGLKAGPNALLCFVRKFFDNTFEAMFDAPRGDGVRVEGLTDGELPWTLVMLPEFDWAETDLCWLSPPRADRTAIEARYREAHERWGVDATASLAALRDWTRERDGKPATRDAVAWEDPHAAFERREPVREIAASATTFPITLQPQPDGDVELHIDLGDQYAGYYGIDVDAPEGATLDLFAVEHVERDGRVQHTPGARNGFRYVCRAGRQSHRSLLRRSGRHLFLTARELRGPLTIHRMDVVESRYPATVHGSFACDDERLNKLWQVARRTMELSMDDVYIDSLYEQTLWVGDLQTEQLYGLWAFDARDISLRSLRIAAKSLERLPMIGAQVPSSWEMILSAWSFLWGIAVWDFYEYTGDRAALVELWPAVRKNIAGAETYLNARGLFEASFWNLFDWAPIRQGHRCVLHNAMFLVGAIDAALRCAAVLGEEDDARWLRNLRRRVADGANATFDESRGGYPDAFDEAGEPVGFSQHAQFLAILFGVAPPERVAALTKLLVDPPEGVTLPGSPFALHFLYGTLERLGMNEALVAAILGDYEPILAAGATTMWEMLPRGTDGTPGWPTRSHCHGWSASPIYYLPRVVLGIRPTAPGGAAFEVRPSLGKLAWAEGGVATPHGPLCVRVERRADGRQHVTVTPPADAVRVTVVEDAMEEATC